MSEAEHRFPSVEWFYALNKIVHNDQERFRKLGYIDVNVGVEVTQNSTGPLSEPARLILKFGAYALDGVVDVESFEEADFTLSASADTWRKMLQNISENGEADLQNTLNSLHFSVMDVKAENQLQTDLFFRVNSSLQAFFDASSEVETVFC